MRKIASILTICVLATLKMSSTATAGNIPSYLINSENIIAPKVQACEVNLNFEDYKLVSKYLLENKSCLKLKTNCNLSQLNSNILSKAYSNNCVKNNINGTKNPVTDTISNVIKNTEVSTSTKATTSATKPVEKPTSDATTATKAPVTSQPATTATKAPVTSQPATKAPVATQPATSATTSTDTSSSSFREFQKRVVELVNKERAAAGLNSLVEIAEIDKVATIKSEDMVKLNYFSHTSPTYGSPFEMLTQFNVKYSTAGENIAYGQSSPEEVMNGWMNSPGHRANILNANFTQIGVGIAQKSNGQYVWTQMFTRP